MKNTNIKLALFALIIGLLTISNASATQTDINGPAGSERFGQKVFTLPNGNIVVTDSLYDAPGPIINVGAVYLYNGSTGALISTLTGGTAGDTVGVSGITVLSNGNFVVGSANWRNPALATNNNGVGAATWCSATTGCNGTVSPDNSLIGVSAGDFVANAIYALSNGNYVVDNPFWNNPSPLITDVGAVTWGNGTAGTTGVISASNSLVGNLANDRVGDHGVYPLLNGNYVVGSYLWDNPSPLITDVGAATWGNGDGGTVGLVSESNSLIGSTANDRVGNVGITVLANGNYVVRTITWDNPSPLITDVGAVTWGNGTSGTFGVISSSNSLVGGSSGDRISGIGIIYTLPNGNYVVSSPTWDNPLTLRSDVGAVTWGNGTGGTVGLVSESNSLVGGSSSDRIGDESIYMLSNGNYVVKSRDWDNPSPFIQNVGAVTWGNGIGGTVGVVSASNSLIGAALGDNVGGNGVTTLTNGNYVVSSSDWDNPSLAAGNNVGAVTWGNGTGGTVGLVSSNNSLIGGSPDDFIGGNLVYALSNGNYVVSSAGWDNPLSLIKNVGAVTWGNGTGGTVGLVSTNNSLVGGSSGDLVGNGGITPLTKGNYVVRSTVWDNPSSLITDVGAVTWGNGTGGITGLVSTSNSLVGDAVNDRVGNNGVIALTNGNYVVNSSIWDNPSLSANNDAGAATWGNGSIGTFGTVSASNSLIGGSVGDSVGSNGITTLLNGNYVVSSFSWDNPLGSTTNVGAISYGIGTVGTVGLLTADNSVRGTSASGGQNLNYAFDPVNNQLIVGRPLDNKVTLFKPTPTTKSNKRIRISL
jgi:hypothetical protein